MDQIPTANNKMHSQGGFAFINIKKIFSAMSRNWLIYPMALLITGFVAFYYLKHKIPSYRVFSTLLIGEEDHTASEDLLQGFAVRGGMQNVENQTVILSSYYMIRKVVDELPFEIDVYRKGLLSQGSYYPMSPLRIEAGEGGLPYGAVFAFESLDDNNYRLYTTSTFGAEVDTVLSFGQTLRYENCSFLIHPQPELASEYRSGKKIYIRFLNKDQLTVRYMGRLLLEPETRDGSIVRLSLEGPNKIKDVIFLNKLTEVFVKDNLEKKNKEAKRIIDFIDAQLVDVSDSLSLTETELQEFRSQNRIMNVSAQSQQIVDQAVVLENEKARLELERNYFNYLEEYLNNDEHDQVAISPTNMGITDPLLANLMQELAGLQTEYFSSGVGERNPLQGQLEMRIRNTKKSIKDVLSGIRQANQMAIDENQKQIGRLNAQAARLPEKERQLLGFERRFNLNNVLYTYLLQRRAEAQIQNASNTPDNELVDPARATGPISPNKSNVLALALILALGIPTLIFLIGELVQSIITNEDDLKMITQLPVLAYLPHSRLSYNTVVLTEPSSRVSEAFRSLRTRMEFYTQDIKCPVIIISSSMPGEGKSFSAINLASAYSLSGRKTLLIGFDLRRPTLGKSFNLDEEIGLTSYLIGKKKLEDVIIKSDFDNLDIIPSGPVPPNPGELTGSTKALEFIPGLREKYDYIIVDSPPIGIVSDIYPIAALADAIILMVRHGHTEKRALSSTLAELQLHRIDHLSLMVNDIRTRGDSYRYAYKYKYEYKKVEENNGFKKLVKSVKSVKESVLKSQKT